MKNYCDRVDGLCSQLLNELVRTTISHNAKPVPLRSRSKASSVVRAQEGQEVSSRGGSLEVRVRFVSRQNIYLSYYRSLKNGRNQKQNNNFLGVEGSRPTPGINLSRPSPNTYLIRGKPPRPESKGKATKRSEVRLCEGWETDMQNPYC